MNLVPSFARLSKMNLLVAIRDYPKDEAALAERCEDFELDPAAVDLVVVDRGKQYDARVLTLAAYERVLGERLNGAQLPADLATLLTRLELTVISRYEALAAQTLKASRTRVSGAPRAARSAARPVVRPAAPAPVAAPPAPAVCPRCFMQLPAGSKACDYCD